MALSKPPRLLLMRQPRRTARTRRSLRRGTMSSPSLIRKGSDACAWWVLVTGVQVCITPSGSSSAVRCPTPASTTNPVRIAGGAKLPVAGRSHLNPHRLTRARRPVSPRHNELVASRDELAFSGASALRQKQVVKTAMRNQDKDRYILESGQTSV